ncbi:MAG: hypothetical protein DCC71_09180 [Proteobacteria bacterium]|nr:MAG: hypothetical protein DCC71_09180 [Pseudomonadota bacterium]
MRRVLLALLVLVGLVAIYLAGAYYGYYGRHEGAGEPTAARIPEAVVAARAQRQRAEAAALSVAAPAKQILFGDLHVHTTFSSDAFMGSLPILQGEGAHPVADACDYARFCSSLDFWSINDHAEASSPRRWEETKEAIRQCNALAGDPANPDVTAFLGWEWSQVGITPDAHYGHKNVVLRGLDDDAVPARPIGAAGLATDALRDAAARIPRLLPFADFGHRQRYWNFLAFVDEIAAVPRCPEGVPSSELPADCYESAATPKELFGKLRELGHDAIVIPHGNTWGFYSPPGITWDKQLAGAEHDPERQILVEVFSGHGNSEEYRDWQAVAIGADGKATCPAPRRDYLPSCWRAGEIIEARCRAEGANDAECAARAAQARQLYVDGLIAGHRTVPGVATEDWLDAGQCRDCFLPAFNYRPGGSSQYALAISSFEAPGSAARPRRFEFGFIGSSDNHQARAGTGYKEFGRRGNTEARGARDAGWRTRLRGRAGEEQPLATPRPLDFDTERRNAVGALEAERQASFFMTGGLAAVHGEGRSREAIWAALQRKEVYATSGDRILLWFHLLNAPTAAGGVAAVPMGGKVAMRGAPRFEVRAVGAHVQKPGCPEFSTAALDAARIEHLCKGECFHPSDERKPITRIEVVRIRPQATPGEPVANLVEDPWKVLPCEPSQAGCVVQFEDPEFESAGRDAAYYVRAIEPPSPVVNADPLRCEYDAAGNCVKVNPCYGDFRTAADDDCLADAEERAWSSPIYVDALR